MTRIRSILLFGAVAFVAAGTAYLPGNRLLARESPTTLSPAPAWKLKDLEGREVSSEQFRGKVVVVDFWATWCGPCVAEIPGYTALQEKYGKDGLAIVGVSVDRKGSAHVKAFAEKNRMGYTVVMADDEVVAAFGGLTAIPTTFLINREGRIAHQKVGAMAHDEYEKLVLEVLN